MSRQSFPRRNVGSGRHLYDEIEGILAPGALPPKSFGEFASCSGPGRSIGNSPSHRAARRTGLRLGQFAATQTPRALSSSASSATSQSPEKASSARQIAGLPRSGRDAPLVGVQEIRVSEGSALEALYRAQRSAENLDILVDEMAVSRPLEGR
jgi:hypothetical protein